MGVVCFGDESAEPRAGVACYCLLCLRSRDCARRLHLDLRRWAGWRRGELKYRKLLRAVGEARANTLIERVLGDPCVVASHCSSIRLGSRGLDGEIRARLLLEAVEGLSASLAERLPGSGCATLELDEAPLRDRVLAEARRRGRGTVCRVRMRSSRREPGIQLADLLAGSHCAKAAGGREA